MTDVIVETAKFTVKARQLNEAVYELHRPQGQPTMQVLFFHGFQRKYENAHLFTWTCGDESGLWPQTWLVEKFPDAHILSVSYSAGTELKDLLKHVDMFIVVENLMSDLQSAKIGQEPRCPVILVGHSFGGLIVKQLCVQICGKLGSHSTEEDWTTMQLRNFVDNIKGVFFYATPHHGIEDNNVKLLDRELLIPKGPLLELVKSLSNITARLNSDFDRLARRKEWRIAGLGESLPSKWGWFGGLIVPEGSSRYSNFNIAEGVDHISIARPGSTITRSFTAIESLLEDIADDPKYPGENHQFFPNSIVGLEYVLDDVKRKLESTTLLGFVGMGGVGKTTLAMALFNDIEKFYQYTCFIKDVKNLPGSQDSKVEDAIKKHVYYWGKKIKLGTRGIHSMRGKSLLLVLDDLSSEKELEIVLKLRNIVHTGSRFIATSRDPAPLASSSCQMYEVDFLSPESAQKLFLSRAFSNVQISSALESYIPDIVGKCKGLPLSLEVIGKHLCGKPESIWKEAVDVLDKAKKGNDLDQKLWNILKLSFDGLSKEERDMFLDAVTVFYESKLSNAMAAWRITMDGGPETVWHRLVELSLVWEVFQVNEWGLKPGSEKITIGMHEQIWSLGKTFASNRQESGCKFSRIWYESEKALSLFSTDDEDMDDLKLQDISALKLCSKQGLKIDKNIGQGMTSTPENLISILVRKLLKWCSGFIGRGMTSTRENRITISGKKLQKMTNLQYLWLEGVDINQTNGLELAPTVVSLHLSNVNFSSFTFNPHRNYRMNVLEIDGCGGLRELPSDIFVRLPGLKHIQLLDTSLQSIPDLGMLRQVETVRLRWVPTASFPHLPNCLQCFITKKNFPRPYNFEIREGKFVLKSVEDTLQLNNSLCQLYAPESRAPEIDIIFFHGLQASYCEDAYWKSWMSSDGKMLWPRTLLGKKFPTARILSVSYDSDARGNGDFYFIGDHFVADIILSKHDPQIGDRPIILIGHCLGGQLLKYFVTESTFQVRKNCDLNIPGDARTADRIDSFLTNVCGIFYYSTPHTGTELADIASKIPGSSEVLDFLKIESKKSYILNKEFALWRKREGIKATALMETLPTDPKIWVRGVRGMKPCQIVEEGSCNIDVDDFFRVPNTNHITICQPKNETESSFFKLEQFVSQRLEEVLNRVAERGGDIQSVFVHAAEANDQTNDQTIEAINDDKLSERADITEVIEGGREIRGHPQRRSGHEGDPPAHTIKAGDYRDAYWKTWMSSDGFHGLQAGDYRDAYWKTWMSSDGKMLWPRTLLGKKFPNARIMSVSYDSGAQKTSTSGKGDFYEIGANFVEDIILSDHDPQIGDRPIILVGHCLGGQLLKYFVTESAPRARKNCNPKDSKDALKIGRIDNFLNNVCGVFFYSTPHLGTDIASEIPGSSEVVVKFLNFWSDETTRLNLDFDCWRRRTGVNVASLLETLPTDPKIWGVKGMKPVIIVGKVSGNCHSDYFESVPNTNHITICQPKTEIQINFLSFERFVNQCLESLERSEDSAI